MNAIVHYFLSALVRLLIRLPRPMATWLIRLYVHIYPVRLDEAAESDIRRYANVNEFFTRPLKPGLRKLERIECGLYAPADGLISQCGAIEAGKIVQAKSIHFSVAELCGEAIDPPIQGHFCTIYLAPQDYHRVHCPVDGDLVKAARIGGRAWPVNDEYASRVPGLYCANRRVAMEFLSPLGRVIVVMVGARNVAAISLAWDWPRHQDIFHPAAPLPFAAMAEIGRFNLGSTVILLTENPIAWLESCHAGAPVKLGQAIATKPPVA